MTSRAVAGGHTIPPNPDFLEFERTDGDAKQWPTNTQEVVDGDGQVNYMKPLGPDDSSNIHWRCQVAMKAAERLGRPCTCFIRYPRAEDRSDCWFSWQKLCLKVLA